MTMISGTTTNDVLIGTAFDDTIDGLAGADTMSGGLGNDTYYVDNAGDVIIEHAGEGTDTVVVGANMSYTLGANIENLRGTGQRVTLIGNELDNVLTSTYKGSYPYVDTLDGGLGADTMMAGIGNDIYYVDNVGDVVIENAGAGTDSVYSSVDYTLSANVENLILTGAAVSGAGNGLNNVLAGNSAINTLAGGLGNDTYYVQNEDDVVVENEGEGTDTVYSSVSYTLSDNVENLTLTGSAAINGTGNALNNVIVGNSGINTLTGGPGNDTYYVQNTGDVVIENDGEGTDTVVVGANMSYTLGANIENLRGTGQRVTLIGNELDNVLTSTYKGSYPYVDTLDGGLGADTMIAGIGNDIYYVNNAGDVVIENAGTNTGTDTVYSSVSYTLPVNVENLVLTGMDNINATGNILNNVLTGNSGDNVLDGGTGSDTMSGCLGNDTYYVNASGDTVTEAANAGTDTVMPSITYTLGANVENLTLLGTAAINGTGNSLDNVLTGNSAVNTLAGGLGNDTYVMDNTDDVIVENLNGGTDTVQSAVSYTLVGLNNVENLALTGVESINGTGNELNNVLAGNGAGNTLVGGAGWDTLSGGNGQDVLSGGVGNDTYLFNIGDGQETITDYDTTVGNFDTLYLQDAYATDVALVSSGYDLMVNMGVSGDSIAIMNWLLAGDASYRVEQIKFADGTAWDAEAIESMLNTAPFLVTNIPDAATTVDQMFTYTISPDAFADLDAGDSLSYTVTNADGTALPSWLAFDPATLSLSGTATSDDAGVLDVMITATDHAGAAAQDIFTITVKPIGLVLNGTCEDDTLVGSDGDDIINGGAGADHMTGGLGDDTYVVDNKHDVVVETSGGGRDTIQSTISYTLGTNVESLTLTGTAKINGTGNESENVLIGNSAANTLNGLAGADHMTGGLGNDTYVVQSTGDVVVESANEGVDTVLSAISYTLGANVEYLTLLGAAAIDGSGNGLDNAIKGNAANNVLTGYAGSDIFVFNTALGATNVDTITDYTSGSDSMQLALAMFSGIGATGALAAAAFVSGAGFTSATTATEHIVYDAAAGMLYYDADGAGGAASVSFATLTAAPTLTAADFAVV